MGGLMGGLAAAFAMPGALALGTAVWLARTRIAIVTVVGESMLPTYAPGDRVLVRRATLRGLRPGAVVVVEKPGRGGAWAGPPPRWPGRASELMIKRLAAVPGDPHPGPLRAVAGEPVVPDGRFLVLGDNAGRSFDSRQVGYFPADRLLGVVLRPLGRAQAVPPGILPSN